MDLIVEGIKKAFFLIFTLDAEVLGITLLSLKVSGLATLISLVIGIIGRDGRGPLPVSRAGSSS